MLTSLFVVLMSFQVGMVTDGMMSYGYTPSEDSKLILDSQFYANFTVELQILKIFFIRGSINSPFNRVDGEKMGSSYPTFSPDREEYKVMAGINYNGFELGYVHECRHPVFTYNGSNKDNYTVLEGAYNEVYLRFDLKKEF